MSSRCPSCGQDIDYVQNIDDLEVAPSAGDTSICATCGEVSIYTGVGYHVRQPNEMERLELLRNPDVLTAVGQLQRTYRPERHRGYLWKVVDIP